MWSLAVCVLVGLVATANGVPEGCRGDIDLALLVDTSASLREFDPPGRPLTAWRLLLGFARQLVDRLPTGNGTRVAAIKFSTDARLEFGLDESASRVRQAIDGMRHIGGNTNTAAALQLAREKVFGPSAAAPGRRRVTVLLTDGLSNVLPAEAVPQAGLLKAADVEVFTVGVTDYIDDGHLRRIASAPHRKHFLRVSRFDQLGGLVEVLVHRICGVTDPPTECIPGCEECSDTTSCDACQDGRYYDGTACAACLPNCTACSDTITCDVCQTGYYWEVLLERCTGCDLHADIAFVLDNSGSIRDKHADNYPLLMEFVKNVVSRLNVDNGDVRVSAVRFSNEAKIMFPLDRYSTQQQLGGALDAAVLDFDGGDTNTYGGLHTMRTAIFGGGAGDRPTVRDMAIVITDGESTINKNLTIDEATLAKRDGISMFVIGVTSKINETELKGVSSRPLARYYFNSTAIGQLDSLLVQLTRHICDENHYRGSMPSSAAQTWVRGTHVENGKKDVHSSMPSSAAQTWVRGTHVENGKKDVHKTLARQRNPTETTTHNRANNAMVLSPVSLHTVSYILLLFILRQLTLTNLR